MSSSFLFSVHKLIVKTIICKTSYSVKKSCTLFTVYFELDFIGEMIRTKKTARKMRAVQVKAI
ncbi:hypothetical protein HPL003_17500 [Paenibacillus terrae HPL-003]|uniref:Uncharacterized protein n=1 Tax=Paenibacillus terrae (strain HPL-003) TaxID=985665 RepID=G7VZF0_PAETH|nr:hypothetical protein HPL003_17500 [Paenibacillus terrae HPL-003]